MQNKELLKALAIQGYNTRIGQFGHRTDENEPISFTFLGEDYIERLSTGTYEQYETLLEQGEWNPSSVQNYEEGKFPGSVFYFNAENFDRIGDLKVFFEFLEALKDPPYWFTFAEDVDEGSGQTDWCVWVPEWPMDFCLINDTEFA